MTPAELITQGRSAVEAELARIETELASAKQSAVLASAAVAAELQKHLDVHSAEVATATMLIARAGVVAGVLSPSAVSLLPVAHLTGSFSTANSVKRFFVPFTWKHGMLMGIMLMVAHYLLGKVI